MMFDVAMRWAARGWPVFPLVAGGKTPITRRGFHDASVDVDQLRRWWGRWPGANVGIATGAARLVVIDFDTGGADHCGDALAALASLVPPGETMPATLEVRTPSGGEHWYHLVAAGVEMPPSSAGRLARHVDVRADGGYIVAPGSATDRGAYVIERDGPVAYAPDWLIALARARPLPTSPTARPPERPAARHGIGRDYGLVALDDECDAVARATPGTRNAQLNASAFALGQLVAGGVLDERETISALLAAAARCGLDDREAVRTVASGLAAGARIPRRPTA